MNIYLILFFLATGFFAGYKGWFKRITNRIIDWGLIILLMVMGARMGIDDNILHQIHTLGIQAICFALASIIFSILIVKIISVFISTEGKTETEINADGGGDKIMYQIGASVFAGVIVGMFFLPESFLTYIDLVSTVALAVLFLGIGMDLGDKKGILNNILKTGWKILLIPAAVIIGSLFGSLMVGLILGFGWNEALAIGAGFGWYSLSGVIITNFHSIELGSLAFLTNLLREFFTVLILPFVVKYLGHITAVAPGGATTMDVTLPLIKKTAGDEMVLPALINGIILTALVPILVPLFLKM